jgi:lysophospholipase L1-like esterase
MTLRKKILFSVITVILFFTLLEGVLRFTWKSDQSISELARAIAYDSEESEKWWNTYEFNNLRLRGKDIAPKVSQDVYRIVTIGDSWTFGLNVANDSSYPSQLEAYLEAHVPEKRVEVINAGYPGNNVNEILTFFKEHEEVLTPDCVIFLGGMNGLFEKPTPQIEYLFSDIFSSAIGKRLSESHTFEYMGHLLDRRRYKEPKYDEALYGEWVEKFSNTFDELEKKGIDVILLNYFLPRKSEDAPLYCFYETWDLCDFSLGLEEIIKISKAKNSDIHFIDMKEYCSGLPNLNDYFLPYYHVHPNHAGYTLMAERIGEYIVNHIFAKKRE